MNRKCLLGLWIVLWVACRATGAVEKPNVVIIYGDDVGYGDVACMGAKNIPTPNVDRLAKEGILFRDGHATSATCTPSRVGMLRGIYPWRERGTGIARGDANAIIKPEHFTLANLFKKNGYATSVVGKWHLGLGDSKIDWNAAIKPGPLEIGFDESFIIPATGDRVPCVYLEGHYVKGLDPADPITVDYRKPIPNANLPVEKNNPDADVLYPGLGGHDKTIVNRVGRIGYMSGGRAALWDDETMADTLTERAVDFIERKKGGPFFLYFASHDIHVPRISHPRFRGKSGSGLRGDAMVQLDWCVGEILNTLDRHDLVENTIVVFTSDNGPILYDGYDDKAEDSLNGHDPSGPFRGTKYTYLEGGTRVPFIIRWPAKIKPAVSDALVCQVDFIASFAALLGSDYPEKEVCDSENMLDAFLGRDPVGRHFLMESGRGMALRSGTWKLVPKPRKIKVKTLHRLPPSSDPVPKVPQLFNLEDDPLEESNLADKHPEKLQEMMEQFERIKKGRG